jgi:hypothetical protein
MARWILALVTFAIFLVPLALLAQAQRDLVPLHKTRSVFERHNIVSAGDLVDAARKLDAAMKIPSGTGMYPGMNAPNLGTLPTENSANLLHFNNGPVAQQDRAAVS